jgi:hypothetical protein
VHALTTYELRRYRRALEHSLKSIPAGVPVRELLHARLSDPGQPARFGHRPNCLRRSAGTRPAYSRCPEIQFFTNGQ